MNSPTTLGYYWVWPKDPGHEAGFTGLPEVWGYSGTDAGREGSWHAPLGVGYRTTAVWVERWHGPLVPPEMSFAVPVNPLGYRTTDPRNALLDKDSESLTRAGYEAGMRKGIMNMNDVRGAELLKVSPTPRCAPPGPKTCGECPKCSRPFSWHEFSRSPLAKSDIAAVCDCGGSYAVPHLGPIYLTRAGEHVTACGDLRVQGDVRRCGWCGQELVTLEEYRGLVAAPPEVLVRGSDGKPRRPRLPVLDSAAVPPHASADMDAFAGNVLREVIEAAAVETWRRVDEPAAGDAPHVVEGKTQ